MKTRTTAWAAPHGSRRRILSVLLSLTICLSLLPATALAAQRLSNREIAEKLFLSEGSVRQYINQLYTKLQIQGDPRSKRKRLVQLLDPKT